MGLPSATRLARGKVILGRQWESLRDRDSFSRNTSGDAEWFLAYEAREWLFYLERWGVMANGERRSRLAYAAYYRSECECSVSSTILSERGTTRIVIDAIFI
jgi:hypothetical protein